MPKARKAKHTKLQAADIVGTAAIRLIVACDKFVPSNTLLCSDRISCTQPTHPIKIADDIFRPKYEHIRTNRSGTHLMWRSGTIFIIEYWTFPFIHSATKATVDSYKRLGGCSLSQRLAACPAKKQAKNIWMAAARIFARHIVMIEGFSNRQYVIDEENAAATDVWFYFLHHRSVNRKNSRSQRCIHSAIIFWNEFITSNKFRCSNGILLKLVTGCVNGFPPLKASISAEKFIHFSNREYWTWKFRTFSRRRRRQRQWQRHRQR